MRQEEPVDFGEGPELVGLRAAGRCERRAARPCRERRLLSTRYTARTLTGPCRKVTSVSSTIHAPKLGAQERRTLRLLALAAACICRHRLGMRSVIRRSTAWLGEHCAVRAKTKSREAVVRRSERAS